MGQAPSDAASVALVGSLDGLNADGELTGWLWCAAEPEVRRRIVVLVDGVEVTQAMADLTRADLAAAGIGDGAHGFQIRLPADAVASGATAHVTLRDAGTGQSIGDPIPVGGPAPAITRPERPLSGNLDQVTNDGWITGWCWYPSDPETRVALEILIDGEAVGTATANLPRPDLAGAGIGDGAYGFSFAVPWSIMAQRGALTVTVREAATGAVVGVPVALRMGLRAHEEDRVADLERQLRILRAEVALHAEQVTGRDEDRAARALFRTVAAFFHELADAPAGAGFGATGLRGAVAGFADRHPPLTLSVPRAPDATILLTADAPPDSVHRAIAALVATGADRRADVVLLDDGQDGAETVLMPGVVANLRYVRVAGPAIAARNQAAIAARNQAAIAARAPVLIFLAASLVAQDGWLDALLATLDAEPDCDIVAARVLRPDASVESAGLRIGADLDPAPIDTGASAVLHAIDAAADGAVALRRDAFLAAGGLHAAYDDPAAALVELCLTARAAGRSVLGQPRAELIRPADAPAPASIDTEQRARLHRRWRATPRPATQADTLGHVLFIDGGLPRPDRDAGSLIAMRLAVTLRDLGWRVTFAAVDAGSADPADITALELRGIEVVRPGQDGSPTDFLRTHGATLGLVVVCRYMHAALLFERIAALAPAAARVFVPVDLHHLRQSREAELAGRADPAVEAIRAHELAIVEQADATILYSDHELDLLARTVAREKLHLLRWIVPTATDIPGFGHRRGICFVGSFLHPPNLDAVLWFAAAIMPILRRKRPGLPMSIIGADPPERITALAAPDVTVCGWVADLDARLRSARLTVAPIRYGAGFKGKVATSLAAGVPVVATAMAVEGTGLRNGDGVLVADDARAFAAAIIRLHDDDALWTAQSERGLTCCRALYSPASGRAVWRTLLAQLGRPFRPL